jgi:hypothetical protein
MEMDEAVYACCEVDLALMVFVFVHDCCEGDGLGVETGEAQHH